MKKGKFIVIDGTDGSGKATQVALLKEHLYLEGYKVKVIDFPEYYGNFFGKFIGHCLTEQYFNFLKVHPKIASVLYAADRFESKEKIEKWLKEGYIVIANRYVSANQIHQGGKIRNTKKREAFIKWLDEMEYKVFKIPKPDKVFYLRVPIDFILKLIKERSQKTFRAYASKRKDIVEGDVEYLANSGNAALWLSKFEKNWVKVECVKDGVMLSREEIHQEIYGKVKKLLK
jgi:dTMP kinase